MTDNPGPWQPEQQPQWTPPVTPAGTPQAPGYQPYPYPPAPVPPKNKRTVKVLAGIAVGLVLLCGGISAIAAAVSGNHPTATSSTPGRQTATTAAPAQLATPAANGTAAAVLQWWDGGGSGLADKLAGDFDELSAAANLSGSAQNTAVHTACGHLQTDVEAAQAFKPIPDATAQAAWAKALALYARGATDCLSGTERVDATLVGRASDEIGQGNDALGQVTARIKELSGR